MDMSRTFKMLKWFMGIGAFFLILSQVADAHAQPASINCTAGCTSIEQWQGTTYGGSTWGTVNDPGFYTTGAYYMEWLRFDNANNAAHLDIGQTKNTYPGGAPYCNNLDTKLQEFVYIWNADLSLQNHICYDVPSADYNHQDQFYGKPSFTCHAFFNEADGVLDEWNLLGNCFDVEQTSYGRMNLYVGIVDNVSNHQVYGSKFITNQWADLNFTYQYQTVNPEFSQEQGAVKLYIQVSPTVPGSNGGTFYFCVYGQNEIPPCTLGK